MRTTIENGRVWRAAALVLAAMLTSGTAMAAQFTLDWDSPAIDWPQSTIPGNFSETYSVGGSNVTLTFGGELGAFRSNSPEIRQTPTGGLNPVQNVLHLDVDFPPSSTNQITLTVDFAHPGGVSDLRFSLFDIDRSFSGFWDQVTVQAFDGTNLLNPTQVIPGNPSNIVGNTFIPPNTVTGVSSIPNNSDDGNATFLFAQSGIRQLIIVLVYPGTAPDPSAQILGVHDIIFNTGATDVGPDARDDTVGTDIDVPISINVLANDTDAEGNGLTISLPSTTTAQGGSVAVNDGGTPSDPTDDRIDYTPPAGFEGTDTFTYTVTDGSGTTDSATVTVLIPADAAELRLTKRAGRSQVAAGELVRYSVDIENTGALDLTALSVVDSTPPGFVYVEDSARVDDSATGLNATGVGPVTFDGINVGAGQTVTLAYVLRVSPGVAAGEYKNTAAAFIASSQIGLSSSASVLVAGDPDFEQTTILGKVFHDRDGDGMQSAGEEGIPGVRLATVTGLLIETDAFGRYHIAGVDGGLVERGRNFILKVDASTLPDGVEFTTENPRVQRITQGMLNRIDFGVRLDDQQTSCCRWVETKVGEIYFKADDDAVWPEFYPVLRELAERLRARNGGVLVLEGVGEARARKVGEALLRLLGEDLMGRTQVRNKRQVSDETCSDGPCPTPPGYDVDIVNERRLDPGILDDARSRDERNERVDLSTRFRVQLPLGGVVWATEDPTAIDPRVALLGPDRLPVARDGRITAPAAFRFYSNYTAFIERAEIAVYGPGDMDRIDALATIPATVQPYGEVTWDGSVRGRALRAGDELTYVLRVHDSDGRYDETAPGTIHLVHPGNYSPEPPRAVTRRATSSVDGAEGDDGSLLDGNVLVFRPPVPELVREEVRRTYTLRPDFGAMNKALTDDERGRLDAIRGEWTEVDGLRIRVTGHADRAPLSREDRKEFGDAYTLSMGSAQLVADHLARAMNLAPDRIEVVGKGGDEPVASNVTAEGRALNRRVEILLTGDRVISRDRGVGDVRLVDPPTGVSAPVAGSLDQAGRVIDATVAADRRRRAQRGEAPPTETRRGSASPALDADTLDALYGRNDLVRQTIPIHGSRVRVYGHGVAETNGLTVEGAQVPVDATGQFAAEYLMPVGRHELDVRFQDPQGRLVNRELPVDVTGRHLFYVALADVTVSGNDVTGSLEPLSGNERYEDDVIAEGRLALYLKGKIKGKYLLTAQLDTREEELDNLLSNLDEKDPRSVLRRLDPDRYYPVYGDDSTTYSDTDTQGRFYVRLDWNRSRALWGNYHTGLTGNELAQYNRSLYGAKLHYRTSDANALGEPKSELVAFASEAQTALGHSEFRGTGGSLYYLRHTDIVNGSEKARVEVRDRDSDRVVENITLVRGADYEIDEIQGRIMLARPLSQVAAQISPSLIKDEPLDGNNSVLIVDYEYVPDGFEVDQVTAGARGKQWIGEHVAVGGTYVSEERGGDNYTLTGGDVTLSAGPGSYLKLEYADTEQSQAPRFFSDNGGMTFNELNVGGPTDQSGAAISAEARANFRELFGGQRDWVVGAWFKDTDEGFSVARRDVGVDTTQYGAEVVGEIGERVKLSVRGAVSDRNDDSETHRYSVQSDVRTSKNGTVSAEVRQLRDRLATDDDFTEGTLGAVRYQHRLGANVDVYATTQVTIDDDDSRFEQNDMDTIGTYVRVGERTGLRAEASSGDRGDGGTLTVDHRINRNHLLYGTYTHSTDRTDAAQSNRWAMGQRSRLSDQTTVYTEHQFVSDAEHSGLAQVFGLDFTPRPGRTFGVAVQSGELEAASGVVDRDAVSVSAGYGTAIARWMTRIEFRSDDGAEQRDQLLTSNRLDWKLNQGLRLLAKFNFSDTDDDIDNLDDAKFIEGGLGLAYRPVGHDRVNLLGRYTFLYDLPSFGQENAGTDQRSHIFSLEGAFRVTRKWELTGKVAERVGELRTDRGNGDWFESTATFAALRCNFHVVRAWDLMLEARALDVKEAEGTRTGFLAGLDRHFGEHFKLGVGYNFTDFSDDLTDLDYENSGWFVNFVTKY